MLEKLKTFIHDEDGAVTVDWVVLTAGIVGLCIAAYASIEQETNQLSADVAATVEDWDVTTTQLRASDGTSGG
jgi:Flp pilus assembly pilin Flp